VKLSVPLAQPWSVCAAGLLEVALDCGAALGSELGVVCGAALWSAGCDVDGCDVDGCCDELGAFGSVCANVIAAPSNSVAKSVFFMFGYPLYCCKCICFVLPAGTVLWTKSVAL
jgi:hypothetical protein